MAKIKPEPRIFIAAAVLLVVWFFGQRYLGRILSETPQSGAPPAARIMADPKPANR